MVGIEHIHELSATIIRKFLDRNFIAKLDVFLNIGTVFAVFAALNEHFFKRSDYCHRDDYLNRVQKI